MNCLDVCPRPTVKRGELLRRFVTEDGGQDTVEYAFLGAFIGIAGWLTLQAIETGVFDTYTSWLDPATGTPSVWAPLGPDGLPEPE